MWGLPPPSPARLVLGQTPAHRPKQCCVSLCKSHRPGKLSARKPGVCPRTVQGQGSSALLRLGSLPSLKTGNDHTLQCRTSTGAKPTLHPLCKPRVVVVLAGEHSVKPWGPRQPVQGFLPIPPQPLVQLQQTWSCLGLLSFLPYSVAASSQRACEQPSPSLGFKPYPGSTLFLVMTKWSPW